MTQTDTKLPVFYTGDNRKRNKVIILKGTISIFYSGRTVFCESYFTFVINSFLSSPFYKILYYPN